MRPAACFWVSRTADRWYGAVMNVVVLAAVVLAWQNAPPPTPAPPQQQPAGRQLLERPQLRPSRAGEARENYGRDPAEAKRAEEEALAAMKAAEAEARAAAAAADSPTPATAAPASTAPQTPVPVAPSAVAAGTGTAPAARAARPARALPNLTPLAAIAMLFAPALGVIWMMSRPGPVPSE